MFKKATGADVDKIVALALIDYDCEMATIFNTDPLEYGRNICLAVVNGFYNPELEMIKVACRDDEIVGYTWVVRNQYSPWSTDEIAEVKICHVSLSLPVRQRIVLINEFISTWEAWSRAIGVRVLCSSTVRSSQSAFLRIHERRGYTIRGSIAYKKL